MGPGRFMTKKQCVRLTTVNERQRDTGIGDVEQTALPFNDIPVIVIVFW